MATQRDASRRRPILGLSLALAVLPAVVGCGSPADPAAERGKLAVVTTTTVLADLVAQVGGERVEVTSLVPSGGEVHTFDPGPADVVRIGEADLVVLNGLGLDEWLGQLVVDAGGSAPVVELGEDLPGVEYLEGGDHEGPGHEDDDHGEAAAGANPHLWLNVAYARLYVDRIAAALMAADPGDAAAYEARATEFGEDLDALDAEIRDGLAAIPAENRRIVSFHEAFPYFAAAYGLEVVGVIVDAPGQDPSAGEIAALVDAIRESGARAVFAEAQFSPDLARTVATEAGVPVVADLYTDSLGEPVDTYEGMMRWNADRTVEALE